MKRILSFIFIFMSFVAVAQNDTTKYNVISGYGFTYTRLKAAQAFIPPTDTVRNKLGFVVLNNVPYVGNGSFWLSVSGALYSIDTTTRFGGVKSIYRAYLDSIYFKAILDSKLFISDSAAIYQSKYQTDSARMNLYASLAGKQATLVSGSNIRTINGNTLLGPTDLVIAGGVTSVNTRTGAVVINSSDITSGLGYIPLDTLNGTFLKTVTLSNTGVIHNTPTYTYNPTTKNYNITQTLATQLAHSLLGTVTVGAPSFIQSIDSTYIPGFHTQSYYDNRYALAASLANYLPLHATADNSILWNGYPNDFTSFGTTASSMLGIESATITTKPYNQSAVRTFLGLGSNAYNSTSYLPLTGGTLTGVLTGTSSNFSSSVTATSHIKTGATASQFQMGDGTVATVDGTTVLLSAGGVISAAATAIDTTKFVGTARINDTARGNKILTGLTSILSTTPELRLTTLDNTKARFTRNTTNNNFSFFNNVMQPGGTGNSVRFTGAANENITSLNTNIPTGNNDVSFSFWAKISTSGTPLSIFTLGDVSLYISSGAIVLYNTPTSTNTYATPTVSLNVWHNMVITAQKTGATTNTFVIYLDGVQQTLVTSGNALYNATNTTGNLVIGTRSTNNVVFSGYLDQCMIYNTVLTQANVTTIWGGGGGTASPPTTGMVRRYDFEEGTGTTTADTNPNYTAVNGTLNSTVTWGGLLSGATPTSASSTEATYITSKDGVNSLEKGQLLLGDVYSGTILQGVTVKAFVNASLYPLIIAQNGNTLLSAANTSSTATALSNLSVVGNQSIGTNAAAPANGLTVSGNALFGTTIDNTVDKVQVNGSLIATAIKTNTLKVTVAANSGRGSATLSSGTVTISNTSITTGAMVVITYASGSTLNIGVGNVSTMFYVPTITNGTSFVINALTLTGTVNTTDNSQVMYTIIN